ncbi:hypothetical protein DSM112329_04076 [Paraconexibacter sp. AEG42_29]|uniref:Uncharacterized protein n=1 Tax=Paraconexibacter sp. AEG42_29 TaxID=2997339 RepID=A0AAU7AZL9_9ACTN
MLVAVLVGVALPAAFPSEQVDVSLVTADESFLAPGVHRGFNVTAYTPLGFSGPGATQALQALAATGSTHAAFVPTWYQPTIASNEMAPDADKTVSDASLVAGLQAARAAGLQVVVKPHVDVADGTFRGLIRPADYDVWFAAYREMLLRYARIAQTAGAELFVIGDELTGVQGDTVRWPPLIAAVREVFKGKLTYAANWDPGYKAVPFWKLLDYVGIDEYHPLVTGTDTPTAKQLQAAWAPLVDELRAAHEETGKPLLLTELGYPSRRGSTAAPAGEDFGRPVDARGQARAYTAAYRALRGLPYVAGIYWWEWPTDARDHEADGGAGNYTPRGKSAERVLRDFSG